MGGIFKIWAIFAEEQKHRELLGIYLAHFPQLEGLNKMGYMWMGWEVTGSNYLSGNSG